MTIGRNGHTARRSHKFHIKCYVIINNVHIKICIFNIIFYLLRVGKWKWWYKW